MMRGLQLRAEGGTSSSGASCTNLTAWTGAQVGTGDGCLISVHFIFLFQRLSVDLGANALSVVCSTDVSGCARM